MAQEPLPFPGPLLARVRPGCARRGAASGPVHAGSEVRARTGSPSDADPMARVLSEGTERASTTDLLAVLLGAGALPRDAADGAWTVLERFRTLRAAGRASAQELAAKAGIPPEAAARLSAAFALGRRASAESLPLGAPFKTSADIFERYHPLLRDVRRERFVAVLLDAKNNVRREEVISEGILTSSLVHPREVFAAAVRESAGGLVVVHNHPSGDPEPSPDDLDVTRRLAVAGEIMGIRLMDHVVIGEKGYVSFLDRGWIQPA